MEKEKKKPCCDKAAELCCPQAQVQSVMLCALLKDHCIICNIYMDCQAEEKQDNMSFPVTFGTEINTEQQNVL